MSRSSKFFRPDSSLWRTVSAVADVMGLSLLWLLCSLPLITLGPATAALYAAVQGPVRRMENGAFSTFFHSLKENLKIGIFATVPLLLFSAAVAWCCWVIWQMALAGSSAAYALVFFAAVLCLFLLGLFGYLFPTLARFEYSVGGLLRICFMLAVAHLPTTMLLGLLLLAGAYALWLNWCTLLFVPAVLALLASFLLERIYQKHM